MIIISEITGKQYNTVDDCLKAEKLFKKEQEEKERLEKERKIALDEAYEEAIEACCRYLEMAGVDISDAEEDESEKDFLDTIDLIKFLFY